MYNFKKGDDACIWGTDELILDMTSSSSDGSTDFHQSVHLLAKFSAKPGQAGTLDGWAQVTYTAEGTSFLEDCPGIYTVGPIVWGAELKGSQYSRPDGTTLISLTATPAAGPSYFLQWIVPCPGEGEAMDGPSWGGTGGTLKDGVFDARNDFPMGADQVGEFYTVIHIEQSKGE